MSKPSRPFTWTRRARAPMVGLLAVAAAALSACAKTPTVIRANVSADATVPVLYLLRSTVVRTTDPGNPAIVSSVSQAIGDAGDRPGPYKFPFVLPIDLPPAWSGEVSVTLDGLDWTDKTLVVATGTTLANVSPERQTEATLMLTGVAVGPGSDGGTTASDGGDSGDAQATEDGP